LGVTLLSYSTLKLTRNAIKTRLVPSGGLEMAHFEVRTEERSYKSNSSDRRQ
jgi:hypothetical protein